MFRDEKSKSSVLALIESGDLMGTENGCFITNDDDRKNDNMTKKTTAKEPVKSANPPIRQRSNAVAKTEFPPPLTSLVTRRRPNGRLPTAPKRFDFSRSCSDDGKRVVVRAHEAKNDNRFYLKVRRNDGRITMSLITIDDVDDDDSEVDDDHDDGEREQVKAVGAVVADHGYHSSPKMAFPFYE